MVEPAVTYPSTAPAEAPIGPISRLVGRLSGTLSSLTTLRDRIDHLPTWPWPPQLLRGFVTALLLPVIVYVLTRTAGSLLGS